MLFRKILLDYWDGQAGNFAFARRPCIHSRFDDLNRIPVRGMRSLAGHVVMAQECEVWIFAVIPPWLVCSPSLPIAVKRTIEAVMHPVDDDAVAPEFQDVHVQRPHAKRPELCF